MRESAYESGVTTEASEGVYLSIIAAPPGYSPDELAEGLAEAGVADVESLRLRLALTPPLIAGLLERQSAARGARIVREFRGDAFCCTMADIESFGATWTIKDLRVEEGRFDLDLWRGEPESLEFGSVITLVRGTVATNLRRVIHDAGDNISLGMVVVAPGFAAARALSQPPAPSHRRDLTVSEKIDLHVRTRGLLGSSRSTGTISGTRRSRGCAGTRTR